MKNADRMLASVILIIIFTLKTFAPVSAVSEQDDKAAETGRQTPPSSEKGDDPSAKKSFEVADIMEPHQFLLQPCPDFLHFSGPVFPFSTAQYVAVPTPPPWCKS